MITINSVKKLIKANYKKEVLIKQNIGRNKTSEYLATIEEIYPNLFTIKSKNEKKTFSYSDVLIKNVIIKEML